MHNIEKAAIVIADKYRGKISTEDKIKWLSTEVIEVAMAFSENDSPHLLEELGDCAFLISHILSRYSDEGILHHISLASKKMIKRCEQKH